MAERIRQEEIMSANQLEQAKQSIARLTESRDLLNRTVEALEVRAPVSGYALRPSIAAGGPERSIAASASARSTCRAGFKMRTRIDQAYISRVQAGTPRPRAAGRQELGREGAEDLSPT